MTGTLVGLAGCLLISTLLLRRLAQPLVRRAWPAAAVPVLAVGALLNAGTVLILGGLLTLAVLARWSMVADMGGWSTPELMTNVPIPLAVGIPAALLAAGLTTRVIWRAGGLLVLFVRSDRLSRRLRVGGNPVVLVDDTPADAFTVAGVRGCVVISRALFTALDAQERRLLVGHELSHLRRRHHLYVHAVDLAAAANPILSPTRGAVRAGVERWADEDAAAGCGRRQAAGQALARTALVQARLRRAVHGPAFGLSGSVLCATAGDVANRAQALMADPSPRRGWLMIGLTVLSVVTVGFGLAWTVQMHDGFENSEVSCPHSAAATSAVSAAVGPARS